MSTFTDEILRACYIVNALERKARLISTYAADTPQGESTADYNLLNAARAAEDLASTCRRLHARIEQARADLKNPMLEAAE